MKIYLSPSSQNNNAYTGVDTVESEQCDKIAKSCANYLAMSGYTVKVGSNKKTITQRINESNSWGADLHICIHTNAGGGDGTLVMCWKNNTDNKYVKNVYNAVAKLSPGKDDGIKVNTSLAEIKNTKAVVVYVECEFHDDKELASWIVKNVDAIGKAIAEGVCKADDISIDDDTEAESESFYKVQAGAYTEKENAEFQVARCKLFGVDAFPYYSPDDKLYRVQAGAYAKKSNAEATVKKLKAAGIDCYIYRD